MSYLATSSFSNHCLFSSSESGHSNILKSGINSPGRCSAYACTGIVSRPYAPTNTYFLSESTELQERRLCDLRNNGRENLRKVHAGILRRLPRGSVEQLVPRDKKPALLYSSHLRVAPKRHIPSHRLQFSVTCLPHGAQLVVSTNDCGHLRVELHTQARKNQRALLRFQ